MSKQPSSQQPYSRPKKLILPMVGALLLGAAFFGAARAGRPVSNHKKSTPSSLAGQLAVASAPHSPHIHKHLSKPPVFLPFDGSIEECDVLVVGGTPSGVSAALASARRGAKTVLIEERSHLGGDIVYQMMNMWDVPLRPGSSSPVVQGIFAEFFDQLGIAFDTEKAMHLFEEAVAVEPSLHTFVQTRTGTIYRTGGRVASVMLRGPEGPEYRLKAKTIIDATNDANFAARAGAGYFIGRQKTNPDRAMQSAGLLFSVANVNWAKMRDYVRGTRLVKLTPQQAKAKKYAIDMKPIPGKDPLIRLERLGGGVGNYLWERGNLVKNYQPRGSDIVLLSINFGRQNDGSVVLNTLNVYGVNGLNRTSMDKAMEEAVSEIPYFLDHLRRTMPGFEHAQVAEIAPELYIRETRHIQGLYLLSAVDIVSQKRFPDRIALASYPLDLHPYKRGEINPLAPRRYNYTVPLRSMIPSRVDGIIVASRSLSATSAAAGSARVLPITMACGEAAGAAGWLCAQRDISIQQLANDPKYVAQLQDTLRDWGADIGDKYPAHPVHSPLKPSYPITSPTPLAPVVPGGG